MAYTLQLGKDRAAATRRAACCVFPEDIHDAIFSFIERCEPHALGAAGPRSYPLFQRFCDYFADVRFGGEELPLLRAEVQRLKAEFPHASDVLVFLAGLERVCRDAENGGLQLFGFAD